MSTTTRVDTLILQQTELFGIIKRASENLKRVGEANITKSRVQGRLDALKKNWGKFQDNESKLCDIRVALSADDRKKLESHEYFKLNVFLNRQEAFLDAQADMDEYLERFREIEVASGPTMHEMTTQAGGQPANSKAYRLERMKVEPFDGDIHRWVAFCESFVAMVGSSTELTNVEKLHYLKSHLKGIALQRVSGVPMSGDNFERVWKYLLAYYDNPRILVNSALQELFNIQPVGRDSYVDLERLQTDAIKALGTLESLGRDTAHWDDLLVYLVVSKFDANTVKEWEHDLGASTTPPTWEQLQKFIVGRVRSLQAYDLTRRALAPQGPAKVRTEARVHHAAASSGAEATLETSSTFTSTADNSGSKPPSQAPCVLCNGDHSLAVCRSYERMTTDERYTVVCQHRLCFNCLGKHRSSDCRSRRRCAKCSRKHHTSIHREGAANATVPVPVQPQSTDTAASVNVGIAETSKIPILLATAVLFVLSRSGETVPARALIDQSSEITLITESLAQKLRLSRNQSSIPVIGIGAQSSLTTRGVITVTLTSRVRPEFECEVQANVLPRLTGYLPSIGLREHDWPHLRGLKLADPEFYKPGTVDLVVGAAVYARIIEEGIRKGPVDAPIAQNTQFGWILSGSASAEGSGASTGQACRVSRGYSCTEDRQLQDLLKRFWMQEEDFTQTPESSDDMACEEHFRKTHSRDGSGRYIVRLPFRRPLNDLGDTYQPSLAMLQRVKRKFQSDATLRDAYVKFMDEYERLGHMRHVAPEEVPQNACYLPHFAVVRGTSTTTKHRVVFHGSFRTSTGISVNDCLHAGPKLLPNLADVVLRWRRHEYVFSADVEKMFRQIVVHPEDRRAQYILWNRNLEEPAEPCELITVTYGHKSAPFLANRTVRQLGKDEGRRFPRARGVTDDETYVDDVFSGAASIEDGKEKIQQIIGLFNAGGFPLRKWTANHRELLADVPIEHQETSPLFSFDGGPLFRTLGLAWHAVSDAFVFTAVDQPEPPRITKRSVLSRLAQVFDPLGWLAPVIIQGKMFMQELWKLSSGWDEELPEPFASRWKNFLSGFQTVPTFTISRWLQLAPTIISAEIHGFSDASQAAMGVVAYLRIRRANGECTSTLISAKTKVAPPKRDPDAKRTRSSGVTILRLELSAAALLVKHVSHIREVLHLGGVPVHLWNDSSTTLYWIQGDPGRWKEFVKNRVTLIQQTLPDAHWHHVPGEENPADCASRGLTPQQLARHEMWWHGPPWLQLHSGTWPTFIPEPAEATDLEEKQHVFTSQTGKAPWSLIEDISSLTELLRLTA